MKNVILRLLPLLLATGLSACADTVESEGEKSSGTSLCLVDYETCINPILDATLHSSTGVATCSSAGCHSVASGSGGAFKIYANAAPGASEMMANYFAAKAFANLDDPGNSKLLLEPLTGSASITGTHTGGDIFPGTQDACYAAMLQWVSRRVDDASSSNCGVCTAPAVSGCGF